MASKFASPPSSSLSSSAPVVPQNQLTITDLNWVLLLLTRHGYSGVTYRNLGLYLGLSLRRLDAITSKNRGNTDGGLRGILTKWLEKADNVQYTVQEKGGPTISSLISALRKIGENGVADGIDMEIHPACRILSRYSSNQTLLSVLHVPQLGIELYKAGLTQKMIVPHYIHEELPGDIKAAVYIDHRKLIVFADVLCKYTATAEIGRAIMRDYKEVYGSGDENGLKMYLPWSITSKFKTMQFKFGQTFLKFGSIIKSNPQSPSLYSIKYVLSHAYDKTLLPQLAQHYDISDILQLVRDHSSLDDIRMLKFLVNEFNIEEAKPVIKEYKEAVEELKMKVGQFLEEELSKASSIIKHVTIVVDKDSEESVIKDVQRLSLAILPYHIELNVIRSDDSMWEDNKPESYTNTYVGPTVQSKDTTLTTEVPAGTTEKDEDQVVLLQEKVESIQKQLEEEKEQFYEQAMKKYEEEILQQKRKHIQNEERIP